MGAIMTYGSYLDDKDEIPSNAMMVAGLDTGVALLAGFALFPAILPLGSNRARVRGLPLSPCRPSSRKCLWALFSASFFSFYWALPP